MKIEKFEKGIPVPTQPYRPVKFRNPEIRETVAAFARMEPGDSFFIPGGGEAEIKQLRRPFTVAGLGYLARTFTSDPHYKIAGVRVWRQLGAYDNEL